MPWTDDRVRETASAPGTGAVTLLGAVAGYQSFATSTGSLASAVRYVIADQSGTNWEVGTGTFNGTTGLTRDTVSRSSNAGALTNFSAGTQDVFCTFDGADARGASRGAAWFAAAGWALP